MTDSILSVENGVVNLAGEVTFSNVEALKKQGELLFSSNEVDITLDLKNLLSAKSIVLSLMLSWLRFADRKKRNIKIVNMPPQLFAMARVSGLENVLPIHQ